MEKELKFRTPEGKLIYGTLTYPKPKTKSVLVMVHGLTGHCDDAKHLFIAREASKKGLAAFRFDLYSWKPGARLLHECDVSTHARDLELVVAKLRKKGFSKVVVAGHSMGGPTILLSNPQIFDGVILWDVPGDRYFKQYPLGKYMNRYKSIVLDWGTRMLAGTKIERQCSKGMNLLSRVGKFTCPILFLVAGKGYSLKDNSEMQQAAAKNGAITRLVNIPHATHNFHEEGALELMIKETVSWFKKCSR